MTKLVGGSQALAAALVLVALLATHAALGQGAPAQPASWHTMTGPERSFTAELPVAPKYTAVQMKTGGGGKYTMHQYLLEQGAVAYVVQSAIYPTDVNTSNPRTNLQAGLDNAAKGMEGGKWQSVDWGTHQALPAVDALGSKGGHAIRSFSVLKGRQIFTLTYAGPVGSARGDNVNRFIKSLRIGR